MPNNITTFGQTPYVDDFQISPVSGGKTPEEKNYLRILYKPGVSVQARELNQMQSMLQSQIDSLGKSSFADGASVVGGEKQFDDSIYAVDIDINEVAVFRDEDKKHYLDNITTLQYQEIDTTSTDSPQPRNYINATVLHYVELGNNDIRFFVRYDNAYQRADGTEVKTFPTGNLEPIYYAGAETIISISSESARDPELTGVGIISDSPYEPKQQHDSNGSIGSLVASHQAIIAKVDSGIYFVKGEFVLNDEQEIYLVKPVYDYLANGKLAFRVNEETITAEDDPTQSLYDNAQGFPNYKAPGADRYAIDLELVFLSDGDAVNAGNDKDFVDDNSDVIALSTIDVGAETFSFIEEIQDGKDRIKVADVLAENITNTLARRTEEESGDYAVEPFVIDVREYYNDTTDSENRGLYTEQQIRDAGITVEEGDISGIANSGSDVTIDQSTTTSNVVKYGESRMSIGIEPSVAYVDGFRIEATERIDIPVPKARTTEASAVDAVVTAQLGSYIEGNAGSGDFDDSPSDSCIFGTPTLGLDVTQATSGATAKIRSIEKVGTKFRLYIYNVNGSFNSTNDITGNSFKFLPSSGIIEPTVSESFITLPYENISAVEAADSTFKMRELANSSSFKGSYDPATPGIITVTYSGSDNRIFKDESGESYLIQTGTADTDPMLSPVSAQLVSDNVVNLILPGGHPFNSLSSQTDVPVLVSYEVDGDGQPQINKVPSDGGATPHGTKSFTIGQIDNTFNSNSGLGKVDAIEIISAVETHDDDDSPANQITNDITSDLELDDGQRDGIYKESKIRYTGSLDLSASTVVVTFKYFKRSGTGSYYTRNSYLNTDYDDIPSYKDIRLSDVIDFRGDEIGTGGVTSFFDPNSVVETKVNYYLNRIDVVVVNSIGEFNVIQGTPGLYPDQPAIPDNAMHLYTVNVPAYTFDVKDIENEYIDNRRYTMRDIGDLESRIKNIEYFNTLSLLEKDASSKQITDDTGMERFKNGIVVDSFLGHGTADTFDPGYSASVDKVNGLMRPAFGETNNRFVLENKVEGVRPNGIHVDGMATLPFEYGTDEVALINQDKASMHMSVNPYAVAAWWGEMKLSPSSDQWKETRQRPDVLVNRENDTAVLRNIRNGLRAQGTIWGSWRTNWVGRFRWTRTNTRRRFGRGRRLFVGFRFGRSIRRGLRTTARIETVRTTVNNRVVDTSFVPFIRSRRVYFTGKLFRPNTKLHLYFDGVDISSYATKAPFVQFADNQDTRSFLDQSDTQIFAALGTRQELITDDAGSIDGYFIVPNNSANKFRTGEREVKLCDSATGANANDSTTEASVNYSATGIIQHRQRTVVSTRRVRLRREWVRRRRNVRSGQRRRWRDPLAQSFMIGEIDEGIFATSVDLYFQRKSNNVPVQMYVVTTDNGYPSQEIIPGSEITLMPEDVSISDNATAVTNFRFDSPIYLSPGVEYAIVVLSNDDNYRMWLSDIGKKDVTTGKMIVKNPYTGVMFKSQNASTWTADQNKDFKFKLNRANFTTANQTKDWEFKILASDDSPADIFSQAMLQSEEVNLPQTSIRYQLALDGTNFVDVTPGEEYYEGGTITDGAIKLKATLTTSSNFVTPLLDLDRLGLAGVFNIVNSEDNVEDPNDSPVVDTELDANHGTAEARYITQEVSLANPADQITTFLEINRPISSSNVRVYIRTKTGEENITENGFTRVLPKNGNPIPVNGDRDEFAEVEFEALNLALFSSFQVKIVMTSGDDEYVPVVKSLRSIATT